MKIKNVLPLYSNNLNRKEKLLYDYSLSIYGKLLIAYKKIKKKQEFFPSALGIWYNPYYFSRKNLAVHIKKNSQYIKGMCLDFGCGTKPYEDMFKVKKYVGVEIEGSTDRKDIIHYDGKTLPFEEKYFDSIVAFQVFEHVPNLYEIIKELNRVLKVGGYMLVTVPFAYPEHLIPYDFRRYTSYGIKKIFEENGFEIINFEKTGNFIEAISLMKNVYINEHLFENIVGEKILKKISCFFVNFMGLINSNLLPTYSDLYIDNVIVVRKKMRL